MAEYGLPPRRRYVVHLELYTRLRNRLQVHLDQLNHVRKDCLTHSREDIATDGSRIETSHKGWHALMRGQPSGLATMRHLGYDFTQR